MSPRPDPWLALIVDHPGADDVPQAHAPIATVERQRPLLGECAQPVRSTPLASESASVPVADPWRDDDADPFALVDQDDDTGDLPRVLGPRRSATAVQVIVVIGATGGAGATTLACGVALSLCAHGERVALVDLDLAAGDTHEAFDVPPGRTLADLRSVIDEITDAHLDAVAFHHPSGLDLFLSPAVPDAADAWDDHHVRTLVGAIAARGAVVIDAGTAEARHLWAACREATQVVVVAPATLRGARRTAAIARHCGAPAFAVVNRGCGDVEIGNRAFAAASGVAVAATLPRARRAVAAIRGGRVPIGARGIARVLRTIGTGAVDAWG